MEIDVRLYSIFYLTFRVPNKGVLLPDSLHRALIERDAPTAELLSVTCQSSN